MIVLSVFLMKLEDSMKNYKVVDRRFIEFRNGKSTFQVVILADTAEDVPEVQADWAPMSVCYIADSNDCKILNTKGEWVDV